MSEPKQQHFVAAKRVLRYLKGTKLMALQYSGDEFSGGTDAPLIGYSDADWAGDKSTRRSTSGYEFL